MRCIEIPVEQPFLPDLDWLIETWDVLKFFLSPAPPSLRSGLIETWDVLKSVGGNEPRGRDTD